MFLKVVPAQSSWTLASVNEVPPLDQGRSWSKCSSSVAPQTTHLPPSRFQTASLIAVGMIRRRTGFVIGGALKSSSPSTAMNRNLNTEQSASFSCQESTGERSRYKPRCRYGFSLHPNSLGLAPCCFRMFRCLMKLAVLLGCRRDIAPAGRRVLGSGVWIHAARRDPHRLVLCHRLRLDHGMGRFDEAT